MLGLGFRVSSLWDSGSCAFGTWAYFGYVYGFKDEGQFSY